MSTETKTKSSPLCRINHRTSGDNTRDQNSLTPTTRHAFGKYDEMYSYMPFRANIASCVYLHEQIVHRKPSVCATRARPVFDDMKCAPCWVCEGSELSVSDAVLQMAAETHRRRTAVKREKTEEGPADGERTGVRWRAVDLVLLLCSIRQHEQEKINQSERETERGEGRSRELLLIASSLINAHTSTIINYNRETQREGEREQINSGTYYM